MWANGGSRQTESFFLLRDTKKCRVLPDWPLDKLQCGEIRYGKRRRAKTLQPSTVGYVWVIAAIDTVGRKDGVWPGSRRRRMSGLGRRKRGDGLLIV